MTTTDETQTVPTSVRDALLRLARIEEDRAATAAATVPYWQPCPPTIQAHRLAAEALRTAADDYLPRTGMGLAS